MATQSLMIFLAFIIVFLTFSKRRCRVLPYIPIPIYGGHLIQHLLPIIAVMVWRRCFPRCMWWVEPQ